MAKKQLTRTLDTSTAAGQEQALQLLQEASKLTAVMPTVDTLAVTAPTTPEPAPVSSEAAVEETTEAPPQSIAPNIAPKKAGKPKTEKRGRPVKGDPNEGGSVKLIADGSSVKRINMDFPLDLYERIESEIDDTGQTVKGFFLMLTKQYFKNRNNTPSV